MNPNWLPATIPSALSARQIVSETALQILKDFSPVHSAFPENFQYLGSEQALYEGLLPVINQLMQSDKNRLMQIIYRVDISESSLGSAIAGMDAKAAAAQIAVLVLRREAVKVISRRHFGAG